LLNLYYTSTWYMYISTWPSTYTILTPHILTLLTVYNVQCTCINYITVGLFTMCNTKLKKKTTYMYLNIYSNIFLLITIYIYFTELTCNEYYYTLSWLSLFWLAESVQWIFEIRACDVITADYTIIMSRSRVIVSRSRVIMSCITAMHDF